MAWYDEAVFYHIYPLGLTGAPKLNDYGEPVHRLNTLIPWIDHVQKIGCNAIYIGPLFESVGHGYETTDYRKLDSRLGTNEDLKNYVQICHEKGIRVILDGVFNHVGRDFFAFKDLQQNRENSRYRDWFCDVNFGGNNEYNDGFSYGNWGGYNLLVKLNHWNPEVRNYILDVVRFWVSEFDIDGIRLDAADVLHFDMMKDLRGLANVIKPEFWLMGEVIHGEYSRWVNEGTLHAVTNYHLHKALYSGCNDHNFFEIAHTVKRLYDMGGNRPDGLKLYNFTDNHDVERIHTKLQNKEHFHAVHVMEYTLPGVPSIYYGSEFAIDGEKHRGGSDDAIRPALNLEDFASSCTENPATVLIAALGRIRRAVPALSYGDYRELMLTTRQYAYARVLNDQFVVCTVNNDTSDYVMTVNCGEAAEYVGCLSGQRVSVVNGQICVNVRAGQGEIWVPAELYDHQVAPALADTAGTTAPIPASEPCGAAAEEQKPDSSDGHQSSGDSVPDNTMINSEADDPEKKVRRIVVLDGYTENPGDLSWEGFDRFGEVVVYDRTAPGETAERLQGAEIALTNKTLLTAEVLDACPELKYIGVLATGTNVLDVEDCRRRGITVTNIPNYSTMSVAQMTFALLLEICQQVGRHNASVKAGDWARSSDFCYTLTPLTELDGKTFGICGYGRIGHAAAKIAKAFGMRVLVSSGHPDWNDHNVDGYVSREDLFREADVISLHCPLKADTEGMINRDSIAGMKDGMILLNTGRGPLVVEEDVAEALKSGKLRAYGCDVVSAEPMRADNPLLACENAYITPHIAWAAKECRQRLMDIAVENVKCYLEGHPQNVV